MIFTILQCSPLLSLVATQHLSKPTYLRIAFIEPFDFYPLLTCSEDAELYVGDLCLRRCYLM